MSLHISIRSRRAPDRPSVRLSIRPSARLSARPTIGTFISRGLRVFLFFYRETCARVTVQSRVKEKTDRGVVPNESTSWNGFDAGGIKTYSVSGETFDS